jgi:hypothetical protein
VAYRLDLPEHSAVHPVFHVSQLKQAVGGKYAITSSVPGGLSSMQVPEKILQHRLSARGSRPVLQVLVKWMALPESLSTWEDLVALKQKFPAAPAWGQAVAKEGGGVTAATIVPGDIEDWR